MQELGNEANNYSYNYRFPFNFFLNTVEPPNKGQLGTGHFVPCSEVGLS